MARIENSMGAFWILQIGKRPIETPRRRWEVKIRIYIEEIVTNIDFVLFLFPSSSLPDVLCDSTNLIWSEGTPFEAVTGSKAFIEIS